MLSKSSFVKFSAFLISFLITCSTVNAQSISSAQIEQLKQQYGVVGGGASTQISPVDQARAEIAMVKQAESNSQKILKTKSSLEEDYTRRMGADLDQFGYDFFGNLTQISEFSGAVSDDYFLGIGDEIILTFHGQVAKTIRTRVDREGRVIVSDLQPISAAGRSFGEFREELQARVANEMIGTQVFVSIGAIRMVSVMVSGEVSQPGMHQVTGLSTLVDVLFKAGGIKKTGSLRRIIFQRNGENRVFDAYDYLINGVSRPGITVRNGDKLIIPSIGQTVAVTGGVKRPGIFELKSSESVNDVLNWAGGPIRPQGNRVLRSRLDVQGRENLVELSKLSSNASDGDIYRIQLGSGASTGSVQLSGHVQSPGVRALSSAASVRALVPDVFALKAEPYLLLAVLETTDDITQARYFTAVDLAGVINGAKDYPLKNNDRLIILGKDTVDYLMSSDVQALLTRKRLTIENIEVKAEVGALSADLAQQQGNGKLCEGLTELNRLIGAEQTSRFVNAIYTVRGAIEDTAVYSGKCPKVLDDYPSLLSFMLEHVVAIGGEVRRPGLFPIADQTTLKHVLAYAGGLSKDADSQSVEFSREVTEADRNRSMQRQTLNIAQNDPLTIAVMPGDEIKVNALSSDRELGAVLLSGEFNKPGYYTISRGEKLSQLIERAGGLTEQSYPYGAVFTRESVRRKEQQDFDRAAQELKEQLLAKSASGELEGQQIGAVQALITSIQSTKAIGRVVTETDPTVLQVRPELDMLVEAGDVIYMPKRVSFVNVTGEVLNPGALAFVPGEDVEGYLDSAGGMRQFADDDRIFVVKPNGRAQPVSASAWNYDPVQIPPGSTIVVPRDAKPFNLMTFTTDVIGIMADIAITAAALASIN